MRTRPRSRGVFLVAVLVSLGIAATSPARASPSVGDKFAAKEAYREGQRLVEAGDFRAALAAFESGYLAFEDPIFLFNMAQCHRLLGDREAAVKGYRAFLQRVPNPPNLDEIQGWLARLDAELAGAASQRPEPKGTEPPDRPVETGAPTQPTYKKWWPWTLLGIGVAGLGVGLGLGLTLGLRGPPPFAPTLADFGPGATQANGAVVQVRF